MRSFQAKVLARVEEIAKAANLDLVQEAQFGNVGTIYAQRGWATVVTLRYDFQTRSGSTLLINGAQHGPPGEDNYYLDPSDEDRITEFFARWRHLCREGR